MDRALGAVEREDVAVAVFRQFVVHGLEGIQREQPGSRLLQLRSHHLVTFFYVDLLKQVSGIVVIHAIEMYLLDPDSLLVDIGRPGSLQFRGR